VLVPLNAIHGVILIVSVLIPFVYLGAFKNAH